jgi:hypothetical protein
MPIHSDVALAKELDNHLCLTKEKAKHMSRKVGGKEMDSGMPC